MAIGMSKSEFRDLMRKNPSLQAANKKSAPKTRKKPVGHGREIESKKTSPKYHNVRVYIHTNGDVEELPAGHQPNCNRFGPVRERFDSRKEYEHWCELQLLERAGRIRQLRRQVPFLLQPDFKYRGQQISRIEYVADFVYMDEDGHTVVEDVKGIDKRTGYKTTTRDFRIKWKMLMYMHPELILRLV